MKDDLQFNKRFLQLVQQNPCLYDFTLSEYSNRLTQETAWEEIADTLRESVADCKARWKNIRGCYTRYKKKISNYGANAVQKYYLADHMKFLNSFTKTRRPKTDLDKLVPSEDVQEDTAAEMKISWDSDSNEEADNDCPASPLSSTGSTKPVISEDQQSILNDLKAVPIEYIDTRRRIKREGIKAKDLRDPDLAFLFSVLPDMKEMTREQKRRFKIGVLNLAGDVCRSDTEQS